MTKLLSIFVVATAALTSTLTASNAEAIEYKCYASKYPAGMAHAFPDGYVLLSIGSPVVSLQYYYVNTVAKETTVEYEAKYTLKGLKGGTGRLKDLYVAGDEVRVDRGGDSIGEIYIEQSLVNNRDTTKKGVIGKFALVGHGYGYDWNLCYNQ